MGRSLERRGVAGAVVVAGVVAAGLLVSPGRALALVETLEADPALFAAVVFGLYLLRPLFAWPTTPLALVAGYGLGVTVGLPVALLGVTLTAVPPYAAARWFATDGGLVGRAGETGERYFGATGDLRGVVAARLAPVPADVVTCAAAVSAVPLRAVLLGTLVGEVPWTVAAVVVGASADTLTTAGLGAVTLPLAVALTAAALLLLAGPAYRYLGGRRYQKVSEQS